MNVYRDLSEPHRPPAIKRLALGFFDGVHLGHAQVIKGNLSPSELRHTAVLTFQSHPFSILFPDQAPRLITTLDQKLDILASWGLGSAIVLTFDLERSRQSAQDFLLSLQETFPALESLSVGPNWHFGHRRQGTIAMLRHWTEQQNLHLAVAPSANYQAEIISSSRIRQTLSSGHLQDANIMLGRPYTIRGAVTEGKRLGSQLGWPTANIHLPSPPLCPNGVYAGQVRLPDHSVLKTAVNIGSRPTVDSSGDISVEAHILDFSGNLYGQTLDLLLFEKLRDEQKFDSIEQLKQTIASDIETVKKLALPPSRS